MKENNKHLIETMENLQRRFNYIDDKINQLVFSDVWLTAKEIMIVGL